MQTRMPEAVADENAPRRVLVVDPLEETRAVLETMLSRRGVRIVTTARRAEGVRLARDFRPDVVVFDCETPSADADEQGVEAGEAFAAAVPDHPASLVLLSSDRPAPDVGTTRYLQKPYDYAPLIHTIEELLRSRPAA